MKGHTEADRCFYVYIVEEADGKVWFGESSGNARTYNAHPLTIKEARNLANWLRGAAEEAEARLTASETKPTAEPASG